MRASALCQANQSESRQSDSMKLEKELQPPGLLVSQEFHCHKVLKVLIIRSMTRLTADVVFPSPEGH